MSLRVHRGFGCGGFWPRFIVSAMAGAFVSEITELHTVAVFKVNKIIIAKQQAGVVM
jgi:hypothetical protein